LLLSCARVSKGKEQETQMQESYAAQSARCHGPLQARATHAVEKSQRPLSTVHLASVTLSESQGEACASAHPRSGWAWRR